MASVRDIEKEEFLQIQSLAEKTSKALCIIASDLNVDGASVMLNSSNESGIVTKERGGVLSIAFVGKDAEIATEKTRATLNRLHDGFADAYIKPLRTDLLVGKQEIEFDIIKLRALKPKDFDEAMLNITSAKAISDFNINQSVGSGKSISS